MSKSTNLYDLWIESDPVHFVEFLRQIMYSFLYYYLLHQLSVIKYQIFIALVHFVWLLVLVTFPLIVIVQLKKKKWEVGRQEKKEEKFLKLLFSS